MSKRASLALALVVAGTGALAVRALRHGPGQPRATVNGDSDGDGDGDEPAPPAERTPTRRDAPARSPAPAPPPARTPAPTTAAVLDETSLMARLHELAETNPQLSLELAREGNARFPGTPDAPERAWIVVKSLVNLEQFDEARREARVMVRQYPDSSWALDVQRHLLSNPP